MITRMKLGLAAIFVWLSLTSTLPAQNTATEIIQSLKPVWDTQTAAILNIDLERFEVSKLVEQLIAESDSGTPFEHRRLKKVASNYERALSKLHELGAIDLNVIFKLGTLVSENRLIVFRCRDEASADLVAASLNDFSGLFGFGTRVEAKGRLVFEGDSTWVRQSVDSPAWRQMHTAEELEALENGLKACKNAPVRFAFALSPDQTRALVEFDPQKFAAVQTESAASIQNLLWTSIALDMQKKRFQFRMQTASPDSATAIGAKIAESVSAVANLPQLAANLPALKNGLVSFHPRIDQSTIQLDLNDQRFDSALKAVATPLYRAIRYQRYTQGMMRVREIMIALHNYHDAHDHFPPLASTDKNGKPLLSWRVQVLPFLEGGRQLYDQFKLDEPWDSPHNKPLIEKIPTAFAIPGSQQGSGKTCIVAPVGDDTAFSTSGVRLQDIADGDGTSRTIAIMEAAENAAVIWTKPDDLTIDQDRLISRLVEPGGDGFCAGFCDASAHYMPKDIDAQTLHRALTFNDGESIEIPGITIPLPTHSAPQELKPNPNYNPLSEIPEFWFNELIPAMYVISGLSGG